MKKILSFAFFFFLFFLPFFLPFSKKTKRKKKGTKKAGKKVKKKIKKKESLCLGYRKRFFVCVFLFSLGLVSLFLSSFESYKKSRFCVERERERERVRPASRLFSTQRKGVVLLLLLLLLLLLREETGKERRISFALSSSSFTFSPHCAFRCRVH